MVNHVYIIYIYIYKYIPVPWILWVIFPWKAKYTKACLRPHLLRKALDDVELNRQSQAVCERLLRSKWLTKATRKSGGFLDIPPKTNMEPENAQLEKVKNIYKPSISGFQVSFRGVYFFLGGRGDGGIERLVIPEVLYACIPYTVASSKGCWMDGKGVPW